MTKPDGDGWIPWPEDEHGRLRQPLGDLKEGETIESQYDYDEDIIIRAWSRLKIGGQMTCPNGHDVNPKFPQKELRALLTDNSLKIFCTRCSISWEPTEEEKSKFLKWLNASESAMS